MTRSSSPYTTKPGSSEIHCFASLPTPRLAILLPLRSTNRSSSYSTSLTLGAYRNIVSWERTKQTPRPVQFPSHPQWQLLMGKAVGDVAGTSGQELEIIAIS